MTSICIVHNDRIVDINPGLRVHRQAGVDTLRLPHIHPGKVNPVHTNIPERPATLRGVPADTGMLDGRSVAKRRIDAGKDTNIATQQKPLHKHVLRMMAIHKAFHQAKATRIRKRRAAFGIRAVQRKRLVTKHVLPRKESALGVLSMDVIWERDVNGIDLGTCEKCIVVAKRMRNTVRIGDGLGLVRIPARKRSQRVIFGCCKGWQHPFLKHAGAPKDAPADWFDHPTYREPSWLRLQWTDYGS